MYTKGNLLQKLRSRQGAHYISAIVLGLNDALVEMTGALAGFTIVLQNNRLIILAAITTGVAATLSMAAAEFLSKEADETKASPIWSALCTGLAYIVAVTIQLAPFFLLGNPFWALGVCLLFTGIAIACFTWAITKIRVMPFMSHFRKSICICFGVALIAFLISWLADLYWGVPL